ncbi:hypothetical protein B6S12_06310 [Helicobacter valdiviensis]|uniref:protein adenylyltransferase n=1 Tax=Helicobacter valdiviensis TaxID=1458358 RepID=A0A2W6MXQ8_9HELI|nr:Fic family protein [Helicobacter valdiviensis]PZT47998.1 hypothetical protein B6S12_06310 [Helicobacter valdiviensis]
MQTNKHFYDFIAQNKLGLSGKNLEIKMRELTKLRAKELKSDIGFWDFKKFNYSNYKEIHFYLFQDIFEWAGKDRYDLGLSGNFSKFIIQFCRGDKISSLAESIFTKELKSINDFCLSSSSPIDIKTSAKLLANLWNKLNFLHPFREGNGRVSRIFLEMFAKSLKFYFDIDNIERRKQVIALNRALRNNPQSLEELVFINICYATKS